MNALEQQNHRTVTRALQQQINDLVAIVSALEAQQATIYGETVDAMAKERTARQTMGDKLRLAIKERRSDILAEVGAAIGELRARGLRDRLRWLLTGR